MRAPILEGRNDIYPRISWTTIVSYIELGICNSFSVGVGVILANK